MAKNDIKLSIGVNQNSFNNIKNLINAFIADVEKTPIELNFTAKNLDNIKDEVDKFIKSTQRRNISFKMDISKLEQFKTLSSETAEQIIRINKSETELQRTKNKALQITQKENEIIAENAKLSIENAKQDKERLRINAEARKAKAEALKLEQQQRIEAEKTKQIKYKAKQDEYSSLISRNKILEATEKGYNLEKQKSLQETINAGKELDAIARVNKAQKEQKNIANQVNNITQNTNNIYTEFVDNLNSGTQEMNKQRDIINELIPNFNQLSNQEKIIALQAIKYNVEVQKTKAYKAQTASKNAEVQLSEKRILEIKEKGNNLDKQSVIAKTNLARQEETTNTKKQMGLNIDKRTTLEMLKQSKLSNKVTSSITSFAKGMVLGQLLQVPLQALRETVEELKNVDTQLVSIRKVMSMTADEADNLATSAYKMASVYGRTASEYLSNVAEFARAGFEDQSEALGQLAMLAQNVGEIDSDLASNMLIVANVAWDMNGDISELTKVVDIFNEVSNKTPATVEKLAEAMQISGNVFGQAGTSIEKYTGLVATAIEATGQTGQVVGTAMRSALLRVMQVEGAIDEDTGEEVSPEDMAKAEKALDKIGVSIRGVGGEMRDFYDIMGDTAAKWGDLNDQEQMALINGIANVRQANTLIGILNNWDKVLKNTTTAYNSLGSAQAENTIYMDSWEAKLNIVSATFTEFIAKTIDTDWIKGMLDGLTFLIKGFDNLGNVLLLLSGILFTAFLPKLIALKNGFSDLTKSIKKSIEFFKFARLNCATMGEAFKTAKFSAEALQLAVGLLTATFTIAVVAFNSINAAIKESEEKAKEVREEQIKNTKALKDNIATYKELSKAKKEAFSDTTTIDNEILNVQNQITQAIGKQADGIDLVNGKQSEQLELLKEQYEIQREQAISNLETQQELKKAEFSSGAGFWDLSSLTARMDLGSLDSTNSELFWLEAESIGAGAFTEFTEEDLDKLAELKDYLTEGLASDSFGGIFGIDKSKAVNALNWVTSEYDRLDKLMDEITNNQEKKNELLAEKVIENMTLPIIKTQEEFDEFAENLRKTSDYKIGDLGTEETNELLIRLIGEEYNFVESTEAMKSAIKLVSASIDSLNTELDNIQKAYKSVNSAIEEYNENGFISVDTFQDILTNASEYLSYLIDENGNLIANKESLVNLTKARVNDLGVKQAETLLNQIKTAQENDDVDTLKKLAGQTRIATESSWELVYANLAMLNLEPDLQKAYLAQIQAIEKMTKATIEGLTATGLSGSSSGSATSATDKYTNAIKVATNAIEKEIKRIEKLNTELEKQKDLLEENKKNLETSEAYAVSVIDDEIKELEKKKEALEKANDEEDRALKLKELQENLNKAKTQAHREYTEERGFVWVADESAITEAQKELDDFNKETETLEIDKEISKWEDLKTLLNDAMSHYQESQDKATAIQTLGYDIAENLTEENIKLLAERLEKEYDFTSGQIDEKEKQIKANEDEITSLNELKDEWNSVATNYENAQLAIQVSQEQGANFEQEVLNGRLTFVQSFAEKYNSIMSTLKTGTEYTVVATMDFDTTAKEETEKKAKGEEYKSHYSQSGVKYSKLEDLNENTTDKTTSKKEKEYGYNDDLSLSKVGDYHSPLGKTSFSSGGIVDYTGLAMVHGSQSNPEMVLNSSQISNLFNLLDNNSVRMLSTDEMNGYINNGFSNLSPNVSNIKQTYGDSYRNSLSQNTNNNTNTIRIENLSVNTPSISNTDNFISQLTNSLRQNIPVTPIM